MLQRSKLIRSRNEWRDKAVKRAAQNREHRRTHKNDQQTIAELKLQVEQLEQKIEEDKKTPQPTRHKLSNLTRPETRELSARC